MGITVIKGKCTFRSSSFIVRFTHEFPVFHEIELVAGVKGPCAGGTGEAAQVVDVRLRAPHHLRGGDALPAASALRAEPPRTTATITTTLST